MENDAVKFADKVIEVIKKIPAPIRFSIISISILMLYWFIAIFLFHHSFYAQNPLWIVWLFAFAFSVTWFIFTFIFSTLSITYLDTLHKQETDNNGVFLINAFVSLVYLCLVILAFYVARKYYYPRCKFDTFLLLSYLYMAFHIVRIGIAWLVRLFHT